MTEIRNKGATASSDELKQLKQLKKQQLFREAVSSDEFGKLADPDVDGGLLVEDDQLLGDVQALRQ